MNWRAGCGGVDADRPAANAAGLRSDRTLGVALHLPRFIVLKHSSAQYLGNIARCVEVINMKGSHWPVILHPSNHHSFFSHEYIVVAAYSCAELRRNS